jgi:DNA repair protein RecO (recombination protein O)
MDWIDEGFVLERRAHGESASILSVLTQHHGRHAGMVHGGQGPKKSGTLQTGTRLKLTWRGRLAEHLGTFEAEMADTSIGYIIGDPGRLAALQSATSLLHLSLPEREPHPELFHAFAALSEALAGQAWAPAYVFWELGLLRALGFSIDLGACAVTGETGNLAYVSPRSGRAVSVVGAGEYRDRLLPLPPFLHGGRYEGEQDLVDGLKLTGYFLERHVTFACNAPLPPARARLLEICSAMVMMEGQRITPVEGHRVIC